MKKRIITVLACLVILLSALSAPVGAWQALPPGEKPLKAALYEAELSELKLALDEGLISSVELTRYYLDRIEAYNEPYNCFITICEDALEVAAQRDALRAEGKAEGLLFGIPIVIKDNMDLSGYHTTNGFAKKASQIAKKDAAVVDYLLQEGAVIIAKANMSTEAQDARRSISQAAGETKNAYSLDMSPGGSSGGSAVATSLNFAAAALGTDTNSSLRIPAALAGCVSLRPTFGLISTDGIAKLNSTRDVPGAITRTVADQAIMLDVLTRGAYGYREHLDAERIKTVRIGVLSELSYAVSYDGERTDGNIDDEVEAAFENALDELRSAGAEVVKVSMPKLFGLSNVTFLNNKQDSKDALYKAFQEFMEKEKLDAVVYPSYLSTPLHARYDTAGTYWNAYAYPFLNNCRTLSPSTGLPEVSVPIGMHSLGAGIGMEIAALKNSEQLLLDIAYGYTSRYDHRQVPSGAPNSFRDAYAGDIATLAQRVEKANALAERYEGLNPTLLFYKAWFEGPSVKNHPRPMELPVILIVIIVIGLLAALYILVSLIKRKQRKKRRKRQPLKLD